MPCDTVSFWLKPFGFFDRNPALDVPPDPAACDRPDRPDQLDRLDRLDQPAS